jgi:hypothetical protein
LLQAKDLVTSYLVTLTSHITSTGLQALGYKGGLQPLVISPFHELHVGKRLARSSPDDEPCAWRACAAPCVCEGRCDAACCRPRVSRGRSSGVTASVMRSSLTAGRLPGRARGGSSDIPAADARKAVWSLRAEQASKQASERARVSKQSGRGRRTPAGHRSLLPRELPAARRDTRKQARTRGRHAHVRRTGSHLSSDASKYHQRADASKYQTCADGVVQQASGDQHGVWMGAAKAVEARRRVRTLALATTRLFICQGVASPSAHA